MIVRYNDIYNSAVQSMGCQIWYLTDIPLILAIMNASKCDKACGVL
jgi:hypothetical protein